MKELLLAGILGALIICAMELADITKAIKELNNIQRPVAYQTTLSTLSTSHDINIAYVGGKRIYSNVPVEVK